MGIGAGVGKGNYGNCCCSYQQNQQPLKGASEGKGGHFNALLLNIYVSGQPEGSHSVRNGHGVRGKEQQVNHENVGRFRHPTIRPSLSKRKNQVLHVLFCRLIE